MEHPGFFACAGPFTLGEVARAAEAAPAQGVDLSLPIAGVRALSEAGPGQVSFLDNRKYLAQLGTTKAGACFVAAGFADRVPAGTAALVARAPYRSFALALQLFYPEAMRCKAARAGGGTLVDPTAEIEAGAEIEPGAIIGPEARIGRGTRVAAGAVVGYRVHIGRDGYIGALATVTHALVGDRVILHSGVRVGQDGFGFAMSPRGHLKVPQIGRVIIQDDVEIGANSTIDRGALKDTIIGEGTKIDNLVQIGHNVVIGRHCVIVAQCGISGSTEFGDFVVMGGQAGAVGHIRIGSGAQVAGSSHVKDDLPAGGRYGGTPAKPLRVWARELAAITRLGARSGHQTGGGDEGGGQG
jgi:UDP-3-O-[3-hydroxymyristoyl] glucosamine N-acyltransferase